MRRIIPLLTMSALALSLAGVACKSNAAAARDSSLGRDLELAAHQRDSLDSISALESRRVPAPPRTAYRADDDPQYRKHVSSAGGETSRGARSTSAQSSSEATEKHTQRDAAIGAAAGAVIGATASRSKVKGGLIGAAVGGIVGAVIGNNVDKTKKKP